ncbi:hypothetical protein C4580_01365 [Candidatus Woesearchaeota archaeon]|nr:MAG: hypothetical protein C4580_01365 [Candidatus Woesearchaeota archaeon]
MNKILLAIGAVLLFGGLAFSLLPHDSHNAALGYFVHETADAHDHGHDTHGSHDTHQTVGLAIALTGLAITIAGVKR